MKQIWVVVLLSSAVAYGSTVVETEKVKPLHPTGSLGTCAYKATTTEEPYLAKVDPKERITGSFMEPYSIRDNKKDVYVSWFAIVRGVTNDEKDASHRQLLLEQKYFDGMTDCHIMLVSVTGSGDFRANLKTDVNQRIPMLSLVRVYGKVSGEIEGMPMVEAEYIRVWPWFTFTLTDLGPKDNGNPKWRKLCRLCKSGRVYNSYPTEEWYLRVLGDPGDFALQSSTGAGLEHTKKN
jgi:hypothetical protein